jgi:Flp pilus assembly protein TadD
MLAQIRNSRYFRAINLALLVGAAFSLAACATKEQPQLVSTGADRESALPWNKQEKWENTGQLGAMADQLQTR